MQKNTSTSVALSNRLFFCVCMYLKSKVCLREKNDSFLCTGSTLKTCGVWTSCKSLSLATESLCGARAGNRCYWVCLGICVQPRSVRFPAMPCTVRCLIRALANHGTCPTPYVSADFKGFFCSSHSTLPCFDTIRVIYDLSPWFKKQNKKTPLLFWQKITTVTSLHEYWKAPVIARITELALN